jgi:hypothetical protein
VIDRNAAASVPYTHDRINSVASGRHSILVET